MEKNEDILFSRQDHLFAFDTEYYFRAIKLQRIKSTALKQFYAKIILMWRYTLNNMNFVMNYMQKKP